MVILFFLILYRVINYRICFNKFIISSYVVCEDNRNFKEFVYVIKLLSGFSKICL